MNKRDQLLVEIAHYVPDIVCICEAVPKHTHTRAQESEYQLEGFDLCTNIDRCKRGVIVYTAKRLNASPADGFSVNFEESCWVEICLRGNDKLLVGCIYRSPNSQLTNDKRLFEDLQRVSEVSDYSHVMICGDFNFPDVNWIDDLVTESTNSLGFQFRECIRDCFFTHMSKTTHAKGKVIDLQP